MLSIPFQSLVKKEVKRFLNVYNQTIIAPIVNALLLFAIFTVVFKGRASSGINYTTFIASGIIAMSILQNAYLNTQGSLTTSKVLGFAIDVIIPPISPLTFMFAILTGGLIRGLLIGTIAIFCFSFFTEIPFFSPIFILLYAIFGCILFSLVGIIVGSLATNFDTATSYNTYIINPLTLLSCTFYSINMLPAFWQKVILFNPVFYLIDGFRYGIMGFSESPFNHVSPLFILLIWILGLMLISYFTIKQKYYEI